MILTLTIITLIIETAIRIISRNLANSLNLIGLKLIQQKEKMIRMSSRILIYNNSSLGGTIRKLFVFVTT